MEINNNIPIMQHMNLPYVKRLVMDNVKEIRAITDDEGFVLVNDSELDDIKRLIIEKGEFVELAMSLDEEDQYAIYFVDTDYYRCLFNKEDDDDNPITSSDAVTIINKAKARLFELECESQFLKSALLELGVNTNGEK